MGVSKIKYRNSENNVDINDRLILNLLDVKHTMRSLYEGKGSQKNILILLLEVKEITQRELTERLGIQPGSVSEILSKLEHSGWILRQSSETDRRTSIITLTESGVQMAQEASSQRTARHQGMFTCLTEEEKGTLLSLLEKINEDWDERYRR